MSSPSSRTVDRVCEMGDEEFRNLLDELVFNKPQSALARELYADASKDEPLQSPPDVLSSMHSASSAASSAWKSNATANQQSGSRKSSSSSGNNSRNRSAQLDRGTAGHSGQEECEQNGVNSQSLQDLVNMESGRSGKVKSSRANSLTQDEGETRSASRGATAATGTRGTRMRSGGAAVPSTTMNHKKAYSCNKNLPSSSAPTSSTYSSSSLATTTVNASSASSSSASSDPQARSPASPMKHPSSKDTCNHRLTSSSINNSNVNKSDCDVESGRSDSSSRNFTPSLRTYSSTCHSSSSSNNNNNHSNGSSVFAGSSRICPQTQPPAGAHPVHVCREENLMEELENAFEMQDLRKQAEIVPISSLNGSRPAASGPQDVDSAVHFNKLDSRSTIDPQYAELCNLSQDPSSSRGAVAPYDQQQDRRHGGGLNNDSDPALLNRSATAPGNISSRRTAKSKKNRQEEPVLAGNLPGNIGDKDVDYLTHYVIGQEARSTAASRRDRKVTDRSKDNKKKAPERSNSQPESSSSSEEKVMDKMPKGRSTSPLDRPSSPSHATSVASYAPDEFILRDEFSDDEKGYHTDQDSGFQLMIGKKRYNRHNRMSRLPVNRHHFQPTRPNVVTATPSSPTASSPSFSTAAFSVSGASASASGSVNLTSRGYESEKEFYADNYSNRQTTIRRRKTASSMPHSERNSPENSDVDSSLSLPIVHRLPPPAPPPVVEDDHSGRISYAQMARSASAASAPVTAVPTAATPRSNATNYSISKSVSTSAGTDAGKIRAQGKSAPHKSNVANESATPKDNPGNEGQELTTAAPAAAAASSSENESAPRVSMIESELSGSVIDVTPKNRLVPVSTSNSGTAAGDSRQQIRKHNSIPETAFRSMITTKTLNRSLDSARPPPELPAVIMCDDSATSVEETVPNGLSSTGVTFGFFDDLVEDDKSVPAFCANGNQKVELDSFEPNHPDPLSPVPNPHVDSAQVPDVHISEETVQAASKKQESDNKELDRSQSNTKRTTGPSSISYPPDVDIETFNYTEILAYIRKAWESVIRTDGTVYVRSFSSGSVTTPEKTSLA